MSDVGSWSTTDSNNNAQVPDGFPEGQGPETNNNCARAVMGGFARWFADTNGTLSAGGSTNTYTLTTNAGFSTTAEHSLLVFRVPVKNTGASSLNVDGLGAKPIRRLDNRAVLEDDLPANSLAMVAYNPQNDTYDLQSPFGRTYPGRAMTLIANGSAAQATNVDININSGYRNAVIELFSLQGSNPSATLRLDVLSFPPGLQFSRVQTSTAGTNAGYGATATSSVVMMTDVSTAKQVSGIIFIQGLHDGTNPVHFQWLLRTQAGSTDVPLYLSVGSGATTGVFSATGVNLDLVPNNIGFEYRVYGLP